MEIVYNNSSGDVSCSFKLKVDWSENGGVHSLKEYGMVASAVPAIAEATPSVFRCRVSLVGGGGEYPFAYENNTNDKLCRIFFPTIGKSHICFPL